VVSIFEKHFFDKTLLRSTILMIAANIIRFSRSATPLVRRSVHHGARFPPIAVMMRASAPSVVVPTMKSSTSYLFAPSVRSFAQKTNALEQAYVEKPLQALDMAVVRQIKAELMEVDANSDGRYDSEQKNGK
jgi:hypothetical protein